MAGLYRDQGIVLRGMRLGEADRIVSVITQASGRIRAVAKGVRRMRSRFGARLDAFTHVDLLLYRGRELDVVAQAEILSRFPRLRADYPSFCAAAAMADAVERTTPERERNVRLFLLLRNALRALDAGAADPPLLAHAFLAKAASLQGLHPALGACVGCGAAEVVAVSYAGGGTVCAGCLQPSDPPASAAVVQAWRRLLEEDWEELRALRLEASLHREAARLVVGFCQWHLEGRFRAYSLLST